MDRITKITNLIGLVFIIILIGCVGCLAKCNRDLKNNKNETIIHKTDTVIKEIKDTLIQEKTVFIPGENKIIYTPAKTSDTIETYFYVHDTIVIDSIKFIYNAKDTVIHDTIIIEKNNVDIEKKKHKILFGLGLNGGIGVQYGLVKQGWDVGPVISAGININF